MPTAERPCTGLFLALSSLKGHINGDGGQGCEKSFVENEPLFDGALNYGGFGCLTPCMDIRHGHQKKGTDYDRP